jgi:sugar phosphate permease
MRDHEGRPIAAVKKGTLHHLGRVTRMPQVWLLSLIILAAYMMFIGTYDFPAFVERGFDQSKLFGAQLGTFRDWLRPISAVVAGVIADKIKAARAVAACFIMLIFGFGSLAIMPTQVGLMGFLWTQVAITSLAVFALRGIYFALLEETGVPKAATGTAVGLVSVIGFTPDIFSHVLSGWFVDSAPGAAGYQSYFGFLAGAAFAGLLATLGMFIIEHRSGKMTSPNSAS